MADDDAHEDGEPSTSAFRDAYEPAAGFKALKEMKPLFAEASLANKELWLLRIPTHNLSLKELKQKQWNFRLSSSSGHLGHFRDSAGSKYNVVKNDHRGNTKYAYVPSGPDSITVREVSAEVSFVKCFEKRDQPAVPAAVEAGQPEIANARRDRGGARPSSSQAVSLEAKSGVTKERPGTSAASQGVVSQGAAYQGAVSQEGVSQGTAASEGVSNSSKKRKHKSKSSSRATSDVETKKKRKDK